MQTLPPDHAPSADGAPSPTTRSPEALLESLRRLVRDLGSALVCYSGGIDSALVLAVAHEQLGDRAVGMTAVSPSLPPREREEAERFALGLGARHQLVESREIERPGYVQNGPDRCFHCKSELYEIAEAKRRELSLDCVLNGTNRDDLGDYRPGLDAARRANVRSPLAELSLTKQDVRSLARLLGLEIWHKPASACLSSRIPYGTSVTRERLAQIGGFEQELKDLGFVQLRVRWHGKIARLELGDDELSRAIDPALRQRIVEAGKRHGFHYVALDLQGYRMGSHNELLVGLALPVVS
jgi:pyridinium-3,5-biscarboxylic acid mononucleotide sulfurtransferase